MFFPTFLTKENAKRIHEATLHVLKNTGFVVLNPEAYDLLLSNGANMDEEGRVLINEDMVSEALEKASSSFRLFDRSGGALDIEVGQTYFGTGPDALNVIDINGGKRRLTKLKDVRNHVRITDALDNFDFVMSMGLPYDLSPTLVYPTIFAEMVENTTKPIVVTAASINDLKAIYHIATIVAGDEAKLREQPFIVGHPEPISPLTMDYDGTERLLFCAEKGLPFVYASGANLGVTAPITPEGGVVQGNAECLGGIVVALLKNEDAKVVYGANTSSADMRSYIVSYGALEWFKTSAMYADMGKYYNLPSWGTAGSSDAYSLDAQSGMEANEGIMMALISGSTMVHDVGFLAHGELYDPRVLIWSNMMIDRAKHVMADVEFSDEKLAVNVIDDVARKRANFVVHQHTVNNFRQSLWLPPKFVNRKRFELEEEEVSLNEVLKDEVKEILDSYQPIPLNHGAKEKISDYLSSLE